MRDWEREAAADAAYDAWRSGGNYDEAYNLAEEAICDHGASDRDDAYSIAMGEIARTERVRAESEEGAGDAE